MLWTVHNNLCCNAHVKDLDAYIHRAGRTGRAGRNGICVMFYKPNQEYLIKSVENRAVSCCYNVLCKFLGHQMLETFFQTVMAYPLWNFSICVGTERA